MKRILVDENLPADLERIVGPECTHATELGNQPTDDELWTYAAEQKLVILTKDADFFDRLIVHGSPPQIVWVRTGNMRRIDLHDLLERVWPKVLGLLENADLVEIHEDRLEAIKSPTERGSARPTAAN